MTTRNLYFLFTSLLVFYNSCSKEPIDIDKYLTKKLVSIMKKMMIDPTLVQFFPFTVMVP